jgi:hypothetical protein
VAASSPEPSCNLTGDPLILSMGRLERYKGHHRVAVSTVPLDASPQAIPTALCWRKRKAESHPSNLSSWDDCVDQLLATHDWTLLCAS